MNKLVRAQTVQRADGNCEACFKWIGDDGHYDHFWGRKHADETIETGWLICLTCDYEKTHNSPSAAVWVERFMIHCALHHYPAQVHRAQIRLEVLKAKGMLA